MCGQVSSALKLHFIAALGTRAEPLQNQSLGGRENSEHNSFEGTSPLSSNVHGVCVKFW